MTIQYSDTLKNVKTLVTTHSSVQTTSSSGSTEVTLLGSEIDYTPSADSTKVVYEINFYSEKQGTPFMSCYLQYSTDSGSSFTNMNAKYRRNFGLGGSGSQKNRWLNHWRFVIPTWSGERRLRIRLGCFASNRPLDLHQVTEWDGTEQNIYCNTNLLVYSI